MTPPREKAAYFIADTHLGARGSDERRLAEWLRSIKNDADSLYMLGDMIDFWWEWRSAAPQGYLRFFGALAELIDAGVKVTWLHGNHDLWTRGYLERELGLRVVDGVLRERILGAEFFLEHGDGVGAKPRSYAFLRRLFRCKAARVAFGAVHPRWALAVAHAWSSHSRAHGTYAVKPEPLVAFAEAMASTPEGADIKHYVFGHYHCPLQQPIADGRADITVLGPCTATSFSYARFDGRSLSLVNESES